MFCLELPIIKPHMETIHFMATTAELKNDRNSISGTIPKESAPETERLWSEDETLALLNLYENHVDNFRFAKKRKMVWKIISEQLASLGVLRSPEKCERKWLNMLRVYRNTKDGQNKIGRGVSKFKYYQKMDEILGNRATNSNTHVLEVGVKVEEMESSSDNDSNSISEIIPEENRNPISEIIIPKEIRPENERLWLENRQENEHLWSEEETLTLLNLYENHEDDFRSAKKRKMVWKIISEELTSLGIARTPEKCERKWLNMLRVYRNTKDGQNKTWISSSNRFKFFQKMDEILGNRATNSNEHVLEVGLKADEVESSSDTGEKRKYSDDETELTNAKKTKLKPTATAKKLEYLQLKLKCKQEERAKREERHREIVLLEKVRLDLERRKIEALETYLKEKRNSS